MFIICPNCQSVNNKDCKDCRPLHKKKCIKRYDMCCAETIPYKLVCNNGKCRFGSKKEICLCWNVFVNKPIIIEDYNCKHYNIYNLIEQIKY